MQAPIGDRSNPPKGRDEFWSLRNQIEDHRPMPDGQVVYVLLRHKQKSDQKTYYVFASPIPEEMANQERNEFVKKTDSPKLTCLVTTAGAIARAVGGECFFRNDVPLIESGFSYIPNAAIVVKKEGLVVCAEWSQKQEHIDFAETVFAEVGKLGGGRISGFFVSMVQENEHVQNAKYHLKGKMWYHLDPCDIVDCLGSPALTHLNPTPFESFVRRSADALFGKTYAPELFNTVSPLSKYRQRHEASNPERHSPLIALTCKGVFQDTIPQDPFFKKALFREIDDG